MKALIFDCDGVLVDTERDGHRVAFNQAFAKNSIDVEWSVELYAELVQVAGGKERMTYYFDQFGWPDGVENKETLIKELHRDKTDLFMKIIESGELKVRPGIQRIVDEAIEAGMTLAVCSTSNERAVRAVVHHQLGPEREAKFSGIFAGDMVNKKKPHPAIYDLARQELQLDPAQCVVVEDSRNGLLAAVAAHMNCIVTTSTYTAKEDFKEADLIVSEIGDDPVNITLGDLKAIVKKRVSH
ncbi:MAG: HAD-IA family hydrolase [Cyclobacteriaceae bacterium]|nr:HAD-IA family hydrolase [Cyclobacteriaceae bacterium HetDA_MAG_MS6]